MTGYDEAVDWFRADPERVRDLDDVDNRSAAIAIVDAVLAGAVPAGRDLTAQDVRGALVSSGPHGPAKWRDAVADYLNRIARPSGGVGQLDTADLWQTIRDYLDENDLGDELLVRLGTSGQFAADPSPRSWSLPAPPPDDVTEALDYFAREIDAFAYPEVARAARLHAAALSRWLLSVVEGEPPAAAGAVRAEGES